MKNLFGDIINVIIGAVAIFIILTVFGFVIDKVTIWMCPIQVQGRYIFIDVSDEGQQGLANLFIYEEGDIKTVVMVDVGPHSTSEHLIDTLRENSIRQIDYLLVTHYHKDHAGAISDILDSGINIKTIYYNVTDNAVNDENKEDYQSFIDVLNTLSENGTEIRQYPDNWTFYFGRFFRVELIYKHDGVSMPIGRTTLNDTGVVLKFIYLKGLKEKSILITGDIGPVASDYIVSNKFEEIRDVNILQVPHHAATPRVVDGFFYITSPDIALVPAYETLWDGERCKDTKMILENIDTQIRVSDIDGDVEIVF